MSVTKFDPEKVYRELNERYNLAFVDLFIKNGFKIYLFGGVLRDVLVGKDWKDGDIRAWIPLPQKEREEKAERLLKEAGINIKDTKTRFGDQCTVYRFLPEGSTSKCVIDFSVVDEQWAAPPDFIMNSLFFDLETKELIDHFGGIKDIENNIIRSVGDPQQKLKDDPVRIFRIIKAVCQFEFDIELETFKAMKDHVVGVSQTFTLITDQVLPTFTEWFLSNVFRSFKYNPAKSLELWNEVGITEVFINFIANRLNLTPNSTSLPNIFNEDHYEYEQALNILLSSIAKAIDQNQSEKVFGEIVKIFHITEPDRYGDFVIDASKLVYTM